MNGVWKALGLFALSLGGVLSLILLIVLLEWGSLILILIASGIASWILYTFLYYRHCRREELLHLLSGAIEDGLPLAPPLRAYLQERPRGAMRGFWMSCLLSILPLPGFYLFWYRQHNFDLLVDE